MSKKTGSAAVAAPLSAGLLALPWRKSTRLDDDITDEIDFSPPGSVTYRHILDTNDELVAIVCVQSVDDSAAAYLKRRIDLFLTAPDLLAELSELLSMFNQDKVRFSENANLAHRQILDRVRAAIAKAEGKQP